MTYTITETQPPVTVTQTQPPSTPTITVTKTVTQPPATIDQAPETEPETIPEKKPVEVDGLDPEFLPIYPESVRIDYSSHMVNETDEKHYTVYVSPASTQAISDYYVMQLGSLGWHVEVFMDYTIQAVKAGQSLQIFNYTTSTYPGHTQYAIEW